MTTKRLCSIPGCGRVHSSKGYCGTHLARWKKGTDLTAPVRKNLWDPVTGYPPCKIKGCEREASAARGMCWGHYARVLRGSRTKLEEPVRPHGQSGGKSAGKQRTAGKRKKDEPQPAPPRLR